MQMLIQLGPGEIFGEISFLDAGDAGASATVRAEDEVNRFSSSSETLKLEMCWAEIRGVAITSRRRLERRAMEA